MKFKLGHIYTHRKMLDAAVLILSAEKHPSGYKLKVRWVLKRGLDLNQVETIVVDNKQLPNWRLV